MLIDMLTLLLYRSYAVHWRGQERIFAMAVPAGLVALFPDSWKLSDPAVDGFMVSKTHSTMGVRCDNTSGCQTMWLYCDILSGHLGFFAFHLILPQFALQGANGDTQALGRPGALAAGLFKCLGDRQLLKLFHGHAGWQVFVWEITERAFGNSIGQVLLGQHVAVGQN